ncbi:hypothetical protein BGW38_001917 [Lunasporangiospora selenospora]|uniref:Copper transporter n=1 Tax=Lunasporangiospora selenospora TaxID=979761 RepID=A0A9P6KD84_9FUNG|nr:hypothetical protein BGW38_001917 [Lunasporangiospora selenospora]
MGTSFLGLLLGLVVTSAICISERVVTSRLEKLSMRLYQIQHQDAQQPIQSLSPPLTPRALRNSATAGHGHHARSRSMSGNSHSRQAQSQARPAVASVGSTTAGFSKSSSDSFDQDRVVAPFSYTVAPLAVDDSSRSKSHGIKPKSGSPTILLLQKVAWYGLANILRLSYMLLAMSFHVGILVVIVTSLTGTQFCLDFVALREYESYYLCNLDRRSRKQERAGYERLHWPEEEASTETIGLEETALHDLDEPEDGRTAATVSAMAASAPLHGNVMLTRSHDCV